ncbi:VOC family protein, partial [Streptomyces sp. NPDC005131]
RRIILAYPSGGPQPYRRTRRSHAMDGVFGTHSAPAPTVLLQHVPEPKQGKNRMHLDLDFGTENLASEVDRLERLGAARLSEELSEHGFRWIVVADPEGNEFCVFNPPNSTNVAE